MNSTKKIMQEGIFILKLLNEVSKSLLGQKYILERTLIGLLSDGHILLERFPGLAKNTCRKESIVCNTRRL
jgi:MoxR-like ATPase